MHFPNPCTPPRKKLPLANCESRIDFWLYAAQAFIWFVWASAVLIFLSTAAGWLVYYQINQDQPNKFQPADQPVSERSFFEVEI